MNQREKEAQLNKYTKKSKSSPVRLLFFRCFFASTQPREVSVPGGGGAHPNSGHHHHYPQGGPRKPWISDSSIGGGGR